jgi:hypothetical protein
MERIALMVLRYLMTRTWMSMVCFLVAVPVATRDFFDLGQRFLCNWSWADYGCVTVIFHQGANIDLACQVVTVSGIATMLALVLTKARGRGLAVLLFLEAGALMVAFGLVLADSATYVARIRDTGYTEVSHVPGLLVVSWFSVWFLLLRAFGAWNGIERPDPAQRRRRSNHAVPLS